jgi:hypothetical protein
VSKELVDNKIKMQEDMLSQIATPNTVKINTISSRLHMKRCEEENS